MLSNNQAKFLTALHLKKYRQKYQNFLVEGDKMVLELLAQQRLKVQAIFAVERWIQENNASLTGFSKIVNVVTQPELAKISTLTTPNQVLAVVHFPDEYPDYSWPQNQVCFYLDGIQDPGNLGSILRIADWFGMPAVYASPDCADFFSPKVVQASMGAVFRVASWEVPFETMHAHILNVPVAGAVLNGQSIFLQNPPSSGLIVIGNEGRGISAELLPHLTHHISIPKGANGGAESLNAAIAAGILAAWATAAPDVQC